jgi:AcrR family transcriptional regulator
MPRITPQREAATRQAILKAARDVFVAKGFHAASIDDVVAASGSSVGAIYGYFKSKDELIRSCVLAANKLESDAVLASARSGGSLRERLGRAIDGWWDYTIDAPGVTIFLTEVWAAAARQPLIRDMVSRRRERVVTVASILLQDAVSTGELAADTDVDDVARTIAALLDGLVIEHLDSGGALRRTDARRRAFRIVGLGVEAPGAGPADAGSSPSDRETRA